MAPTGPQPVPQPPDPFPGIKAQWHEPGGVFSILLIVGGDIVRRAIAQLSGSQVSIRGSRFYIVPVAFSFGWVGYAATAVLAAIGDDRLMPETDCPSIVVNAKGGQSRSNRSWVLGRLLRDWDDSVYKQGDKEFSLAVTICRASSTKTHGKPDIDLVWISGIVTMITQCFLASIPIWRIDGSWSVFVITVGGTLLCLSQGALPQWRAEKWKCRDLKEETAKDQTGKRHDKTISLTRGNGSRHVIAIISEGVGFDLEDLAGGQNASRPYTPFATIILAIVWIVLLLTATGVKKNTWFLILVGGLGMAQNVFAAGCKRKPGALGIHIEKVVDIKPKALKPDKTDKVIWVLMQTENFAKHVGLSLLPVLFPGGLFPNEQKWKDDTLERYKREKATERVGQPVDAPAGSVHQPDASSVISSEIVEHREHPSGGSIHELNTLSMNPQGTNKQGPK